MKFRTPRDRKVKSEKNIRDKITQEVTRTKNIEIQLTTSFFYFPGTMLKYLHWTSRLALVFTGDFNPLSAKHQYFPD